ncbi:AAA family ATPase [Xylanibacter caecicola]|uniref:AAA family ATPase n=1 Tax=Xylanibacter caecicola TaxID=2736294 RepID=UPI0025906281|nr:ATP-binding protein [Xylanibacter caecicola]
MIQDNPFVINGYKGEDYFCDRIEETALLKRHLTNNCNVALISPRRLGKSGLIRHTFAQNEIKDNYYVFIIDIYETKNLNEFVYELGRGIFNTLKSRSRKAWDKFFGLLLSLRQGISFDAAGMPEWNITIGDIRRPDITLDEIFMYLEHADRPCLVAIDEFQTISEYPEKTVEAMLRTRIQTCGNAHFVFSGSKRHMMAEMFMTASHPFYQSASVIGLSPIDREVYYDFVSRHLSRIGKSISSEAFDYIYDLFDGITWYIQYVMNILYTESSDSASLDVNDVSGAIEKILHQQAFAYKTLLYQLTARQKQLLLAIAEQGKATGMMSREFLSKYGLSASSVQNALKVLLDRDFITQDEDGCRLYDKFFEIWLRGGYLS